MSAAPPRRRTPRGQAMVEFALALPIVVVLLFGALDLGRAVAYDVALSHVTYESLRVAAVAQATDLGGRPGTSRDIQAAHAETAVQLLQRGFLAADGGSPALLTQQAQWCPLALAPNQTSPATIECRTITATKVFVAITPLIGALIGPITLSATGTVIVQLQAS